MNVSRKSLAITLARLSSSITEPHNWQQLQTLRQQVATIMQQPELVVVCFIQQLANEMEGDGEYRLAGQLDRLLVYIDLPELAMLKQSSHAHLIIKLVLGDQDAPA